MILPYFKNFDIEYNIDHFLYIVCDFILKVKNHMKRYQNTFQRGIYPFFFVGLGHNILIQQVFCVAFEKINCRYKFLSRNM
jgi:hypothetical protein